jgi:NADH-quinone oxidoreductase subunit C
VSPLSSEVDAPAAPDAAEAAEVEAPPVDTARQGLVEGLGDLVAESVVDGGDVWVRVARGDWHAAVAACKTKLGMDYFCFLSGIDWLDNAAMSGEKVWGALPEDEEGGGSAAAAPAAERTSVAGGETRFQVFCRLYSLKSKLGITLKADLDEDDPRVQSVVDLYRGADWHEREAWEMYGFAFDGHPGLRHIYLPSEFEGHPLRKDFPLLAREVKPWPGLVDVEPLPGGGEEEGEGGESA